MKKKNKKKTNIVKEFGAFVNRGNVVDLAVGIIIGGAFQKIVSSLVADIVMPIVGLILGGINLAQAKWVIKEAVMDGETVVKAAVTFNYGNFIQTVLDFLIIAIVVFLMVKALNTLREGLDNASKLAKAKIEEAEKKEKEKKEAELIEVEAEKEAQEAKENAEKKEELTAKTTAAVADGNEKLLKEILEELKKLNSKNA